MSIPFNYTIWSMNKDSVICTCDGLVVHDLKQFNLPHKSLLVGYVRSFVDDKYYMMEWELDGSCAPRGIGNLKMKRKEQ